MASFLLSDKAVKIAMETKLPRAVAEAIAAAPRYPEGNGVRLVVKHAADLRRNSKDRRNQAGELTSGYATGTQTCYSPLR